MSPLSSSDSLAQTVDDHIGWLADFHRLAFLDLNHRAEQAKNLTVPASFLRWREQSLKTLAQEQPAVERLAALHDQLHKLARLVLMKTPDGAALGRKDYESVIAKYNELMQGLRRLERAFAAAASGLDALTGLRSRVDLESDLAREYNRFVRTGRTFCVALMDIDHFKAVNDTHGHDAGDRVLAAVADFISHSLRSFDDAYRVGGEEFLLCLKEADLARGVVALERLRSGLEKKAVTLADGKTIHITASFGITESNKDIGPLEMSPRADKALYRAKHEGRNRIVTAD